MKPKFNDSKLNIDIIKHNLRLMGFKSFNRICVMDRPDLTNASNIKAAQKKNQIIVLLQPKFLFARALGIHVKKKLAPLECYLSNKSLLPVARSLRPLENVKILTCTEAEPVIIDSAGDTLWLWIPNSSGGMLVVGTDLAGDLVRYRQGDPKLGKIGSNKTYWGIAGERPNYLFEQQIAGLPHSDRQADYWAWVLAEFLSRVLNDERVSILPGGAPGAIVLTGDDDQAELEKYNEQRRLIGNLPITWFLHPKTRHDRNSLNELTLNKANADLGLHPDALDDPKNYKSIYEDQLNWFENLTQEKIVSVRNHGFLNDGYWGHLNSWLKSDVEVSSNIPGFDGCVLTGSLLPARVSWKGKLTSHWSLLTAIGDGIIFAGGLSDNAAGNCVLDLANTIIKSRIPGVMVLNLHPQNVMQTKQMHKAVHKVVELGFISWNMNQCLEWFKKLDSEQEF